MGYPTQDKAASPSSAVPPSPLPPDVLLGPMLRAGRWVILAALATTLLLGHYRLDSPGVRPIIAVALALYALGSTVLLHTGPLTPARVVGIVSGDLTFVALMVECTGGVRSYFFGLYYLVVVASAIFYEVIGGLVAAATVIVITVLGEWLGLHGAGPPARGPMMTTFPYLFFAAVVAGYLTAQLRREIERHREAQHAASVLEVQRQSAEREMALAREVQQAALPPVPSRMAGLEIGVRFRAAAEVGGDFYDFYQHENELRLLVGDAGGKGVSAALVATTAMHAFHSQASGTTLADWCRWFSRELEERAPAYMLATAFCCALDSRSGQGTWVNAGHPPPALCRAGRSPELLEGSGMALGVSGEVTYATRALHLAPGDVLVIYTDGLIEAVLPDGSRTGTAPLLAQLPALVSLGAAEIAEGIETRLFETAEVRDDLTLVVVKKIEARAPAEMGS